MSGPLILLVDDDTAATESLSEYLTDFGHEVLVAHGESAIAAVLVQRRVDIVVMDPVFSAGDGLALMQQIRRQAQVPVVLLSRRTETADRIIGLELGADDYMTKPYEPRELLARIKAILRRLPQGHAREVARPRAVQVGRWELRHDERRLVGAEGVMVPLAASEYRLLNCFISAPRAVLSRQHLMTQARGRDMRVTDRGIDLLVSRLRRKLDDEIAIAPLIRTVRGAGYVYEPPKAPYHPMPVVGVWRGGAQASYA